MRKFVLLGTVAAVLGVAAVAEARDDHASRASCASAPASRWLSTPELAAKFEAQGYTVQRIELKRDCGEAKLVDKAGVRTEVRFDPASGTIANRRDHSTGRERHGRDDHRDDGRR